MLFLLPENPSLAALSSPVLPAPTLSLCKCHLLQEAFSDPLSQTRLDRPVIHTL